MNSQEKVPHQESIELEEQQMQLHVAMLCGGKPCYEIELYFDFCKVPILRIVLFDFLKPTELQSVLKQSIRILCVRGVMILNGI